MARDDRAVGARAVGARAVGTRRARVCGRGRMWSGAVSLDFEKRDARRSDGANEGVSVWY